MRIAVHDKDRCKPKDCKSLTKAREGGACGPRGLGPSDGVGE